MKRNDIFFILCFLVVSFFLGYWFVSKDLPSKISSPSNPQKKNLIFSNDLNKITGNAGFEYPGDFRGTIYNGTDYTLTRVVINISANDKKGNLLWQRDFDTGISGLKPLTAEKFYITTTPDTALLRGWYVKEASVE